jgi:hypothetical protein
VQIAKPDVTTCAPQFDIDVLPTSNFTVPAAPDVTSAVNVTGAPRFCGAAGAAVSTVVVITSDGVLEVVLPEGPAPPALEAVTLKVSEVEGVSPGTTHFVAGAATEQLWPPGFATTVYPSTVTPLTGTGAVQLTAAPAAVNTTIELTVGAFGVDAPAGTVVTSNVEAMMIDTNTDTPLDTEKIFTKFPPETFEAF